MLSSVRRWPAPKSQICQQCARQLLSRPTAQVQQQQLLQQRHMTGKAFAKYGPKYTAKIDAANDEWKERKINIEAGEMQDTWELLEERGLVKDIAGNRNDIRKLMIEKRTGAYVGIDPTAPSLHVGHLIPLMPLFWMYMNGYRTITLIGSATAKVGDPTGRLETRKSINSADLAMNMVKINFQLKKLWINVEERARHYGFQKTWAWRRGIVQNGVWWNKLPMLEVLRRLGMGMRIGPMMSRETVKRKISKGDGMSFAEFSYPLMQAWDWWHLYFAQGIQIQIGGSDQYGNLVAGIDAFRIIRDSEPNPQMRLPKGLLHDPVGFTVPLLTDTSGNKVGKSNGASDLWLDPFKTTPYDLYAYFMRRADAEVEHMLKMFTFVPKTEIEKIVAQHYEDPAKRVAQHRLAYEVLSLVHGVQMAKTTQSEHVAMHSSRKQAKLAAARAALADGETLPEGEEADGGDDEAWLGSDGAVLEETESEYFVSDGHPVTPNTAPRVDMQLPRSLINEGKVARILYAAGLSKSASEGNRLATKGGAYVGASPGQKSHVNKGMLMTQLQFTPVRLWYPADTKNFIIDDKYLMLRKGQHNLRVIEIVDDETYNASGQTYPGQPYTGKTRQLRQRLKQLKELLQDGMMDDLSSEDAEAIMQSPMYPASEASSTSNSISKSNSLVFPKKKPAAEAALEQQIADTKKILRDKLARRKGGGDKSQQ